MRLKIITVLLALAACSCVPTMLLAQTPTRADGGSIVIDLGEGYAVNKGSSLRREWVALHDTAMPVDIMGTPGISPEYRGERGYEGAAKFNISTQEPIAAYEIKFVLFDVWGDFLRTYSMHRITDLPAGTSECSAEWRIPEEEQAGYAHSVCFVSRVLTQNGRMVVANDDAVVAQMKAISNSIKKEDLTPKMK